MPRQKSAILYSALTRLSEKHWPVSMGTGPNALRIYVRMETRYASKLMAAQLANPRAGESVAGAVDLPVKEKSK